MGKYIDEANAFNADKQIILEKMEEVIGKANEIIETLGNNKGEDFITDNLSSRNNNIITKANEIKDNINKIAGQLTEEASKIDARIEEEIRKASKALEAKNKRNNDTTTESSESLTNSELSGLSSFR